MYKRIMIVVDTREASRAAIDEGLRLAQAHEGEVYFLTTLPRFPLPIAEGPFLEAGASQREFELAARANADQVLAAAQAAADKAEVMSHGIVADAEDEVAHIVEAARRRRCQLIVVAAQGRNALMRLLTGSVIPGLITTSPIPVLVCKAPANAPHGSSLRRPARRVAAAATPRLDTTHPPQ